MAFELTRNAFPGIAASAVIPHQVVRLAAGSGERGVCPVASSNEEPLGIALASAAIGEAVTVYDLGNVAKGVAGASVGAGALVAVAVTASAPGVRPVSGASGAAEWAVGRTVSAANTSEKLSIFVHPRQLGGLA